MTGPRIRSLDRVLSPQQREIAVRIARGESDPAIAAGLETTVNTVKKAISLARDKVGAQTRQALGDYARRQGFCT